MQTLTNISRILVGALFIVSGMVKVVDPLGFSYKLDEYFTVFQQTFGFGEIFSPLVLFFSMFMSVLEIVMGVTLLLGAFPITTAWLLLLLIVFFTFLTGFSAYTGKVQDCGCFGDALKLTPYESFYKDLVLLFFTLIIFARRKFIELNSQRKDLIFISIALLLIAAFSIQMIKWPLPIYFGAVLLIVSALTKYVLPRNRVDATIAVLAFLITGSLNYYCFAHLPVKDFRPFAIGKNIPEQMEHPEGAPVDVFQVYYTMKNKTTGEEKEVTDKQYIEEKIWEDKNLEMLSDKTRSVLVQKGYEPPIHDFSIMDEAGNDLTEAVLSHHSPVLLVIAYDLEKTSTRHFNEINLLVEAAAKEGMEVMALTASLEKQIEKFRHEVQAAFPFHSSDGTALKTIIRSNPGLMLIENGVIKGKWHHNDVPTIDELNSALN